MSNILYDLPGPKARLRNRVLSVVSLVAIVALLVYIVMRFNDTGQFESIKWQQFQYAAIQQQLLDGYLTTLRAAGVAAVLALIFGAVLATGRLSDHGYFTGPTTLIVELFRAIPLLVLIFFAYYGPIQLGYKVGPFWPLVIGLTLYNGAVLAEIFRAGFLAVAKGQSEAAYALGMRKTQVMMSILLPQAIRAMLPAIVSQVVVLLKDTALGFIIQLPELLYVGKQIGGRLPFGLPYVPSYLIVAAIYISTCGLLSAFAFWLQKRLIGGRRPRTTAAPVPLTTDTGAAAV
ncbi:amino acid ABC transporter permease [Dactylosporangium matsuzakiense]|uniref:Amino acid ABC transporter permease n=1 Tax=Dactylosporangium matsuzakiense TaxID=53360 RepID=A0A9W6KSW7_9ACTN|nr:amino acid ABC transporter permease [Dactylosporangium matsuzakiense]UWZ46433.1 amino acid ABC transporter permease [Dactylosporangium matsuzakiense]GLL06555.1 amino acid ABC transporter permease [Dactylosporangium matsuzakiense]